MGLIAAAPHDAHHVTQVQRQLQLQSMDTVKDAQAI